MATASPRSTRRSGRRSRRRRGEGLEPLPREAWTRLAACTAAAALLQLDGTVITVALPNVSTSLRVSNSATAVLLSAYFAAYALLLFPGGRLVDRLGARRLALVGLLLFAVGAALGAVVSDLGLLIVTRIIQGVGAGLVSPAALAGAVSGFPPERRGTALGIWGASAGMANLAGPLLGGILTVAFGWRAAWWVLVPLALAAAWGILKNVPTLVHDNPEGGGGRVLNRTVSAAAAVAGITFAVMIGTFYLAEQYLQRSAGYSALGASAILVIVALLVGAAAPIAGGLVDTHGSRLPALLGFTAAGVGLAVLAIPGVSLDGIVTLICLIPIGLGLGMLFVPVSRAALNSVDESAHGRASAILSFMRLLGAGLGAGAAGVALAGGATASGVHTAVAVAAGLCLLVGLPLAAQLADRRSGQAAPARAT
ncbi:MFS transporter [Conexibacter sp. DBS9H8]|uniref:MFS transporter n=1 Tax=Conexibacter sp. DBS9H8 TaxID=2937801 RepID=UPI00200E5B52|nr:MFS transporter [Conexibacter sp. DBS9H8]